MASSPTCLDFNLQVRQRLHQLLVKRPDAVAAYVVFFPRLIVVPSIIAERIEHTFKIVRVFQPDVSLDNCDPVRSTVLHNR